MIDKSEKFNWLVRIGYFSRAILYAVLGLIALTSADALSEGTEGIFQAIEDYPAGTYILWLMVIGLVAYALFRFCSLFFDIENNGTDTKGWAKRIGHGGSGIGHLALAYTAYRLASGGGSGGGGAQDTAAGVLTVPLGGVVLGLFGLIFFGVAIFQAKKGITGDFMHRISGAAPSFTRWLGMAGFLARGVVYAVIGWSLVRAGFFSAGASEIETLGGAVGELAGQGALLTLTGTGLLLFGIFSLILSRYRIIPDMQSGASVPSFRA